jgi:hypothetical protein
MEKHSTTPPQTEPVRVVQPEKTRSGALPASQHSSSGVAFAVPLAFCITSQISRPSTSSISGERLLRPARSIVRGRGRSGRPCAV